MAALLASITAIFECVIGMVGDVAGLIAGTSTVEGVVSLDNPILFLFCVIPLVGLGVGLFKRLLSVN